MYPTYYDFNMYDHCLGGKINFSDKGGKNVFQHSGDRVENQTLLHYFKLTSVPEVGKAGHRIAPFITGYRCTPLKRFHEHSPANLLFDHKKKIIHIIQFPIDEASVGDATLGIPGAGEFKDGFLYFDVFNNPETCMGDAPSYKQPE